MAKDSYFSSLHCLVVDDDEVQVLLRKMVLWRIGVPEENIRSADNGVLALNLLHEPTNETHLVITDLEMPKMNGYGLITYMQKESELRPLKIILITGVDPEEDEGLKNFLHQHPFVYYLRKVEVTPEKLGLAICTVFRR